MKPGKEKYATPVQFCPECGHRILDKAGDTTHSICIAWGMKIGKYRGRSDWEVACVRNGERVTSVTNV